MTPATSSSAPSPNGETDMNDIDIEEGRALLALSEEESERWERGFTACRSAWFTWLEHNAADMFDAIETGRRWETLARRLAMDVEAYWPGVLPRPVRAAIDSLVAFRDRADRTPTPTEWRNRNAPHPD